MTLGEPGRIVILNGPPRAGKSSIVAVIQDTFDGVWMNLGVDVFASEVTPKKARPGMGLRPGEPDHAIAAIVPTLYAALYESIAAHARLGFNVVVDIGHHDRAILEDCAPRLAAMSVLFVGVRCPIDVIMERRNAGQPGRVGQYAVGTPDEPVPAPVRLWQTAVHDPGIYDLEVDTSQLDPGECAAIIRRRLEDGPPGNAFARLAQSGDSS